MTDNKGNFKLFVITYIQHIYQRIKVFFVGVVLVELFVEHASPGLVLPLLLLPLLLRFWRQNFVQIFFESFSGGRRVDQQETEPLRSTLLKAFLGADDKYQAGSFAKLLANFLRSNLSRERRITKEIVTV